MVLEVRQSQIGAANHNYLLFLAQYWGQTTDLRSQCRTNVLRGV